MVDIGLRRGASFAFPFGGVAERITGLAVRFAGLRQMVARREATLEMQHSLDGKRLDDAGMTRGRSAERAIARMMRYGLR